LNNQFLRAARGGEAKGYGEANRACGGNGDVASQTTTIGQILAFANITGRPGFGGIFIIEHH
jgi:hypothetical protein